MNHDFREPFDMSSRNPSNHPSSAPAGDFLMSPEQEELERRWPVALREITALMERIKDIRRANPKELHENLSKIEKTRLTSGITEALLKDEPKGLKPSVARRMANRIGNYLRCGTFIPSGDQR